MNFRINIDETLLYETNEIRNVQHVVTCQQVSYHLIAYTSEINLEKLK